MPLVMEFLFWISPAAPFETTETASLQRCIQRHLTASYTPSCAYVHFFVIGALYITHHDDDYGNIDVCRH